ncbi:MAG: DUF1906 domain-containing protein [Acidobacteria bacterium]|nr:DUF1906 domain-containing protein [Acidobacteriota bacterium]
MAVAGFAQQAYTGFDRNIYPGDAALPALHKNFAFTGYWLNTPPGARSNNWVGKRNVVKAAGFGFLVLFNGKLEAQLKGRNPRAAGEADALTAVASAKNEGFPSGVRIFLDIEEGGRMTEVQATYIFAWVDAVRNAGARAGVYCSGIDVREDAHTIISTARDLVARDAARRKTGEEPLKLWVANDACPPAPGCAMSARPPAAGVAHEIAKNTMVWQYAQSPRRMEFSKACPKNAAADGNCYAPGVPAIFVDLNTATTSDPSEGR